jgi:hypothetical protein
MCPRSCYCGCIIPLSLFWFMICIAPRARRSTVGFLGFVLQLYTFDVQAAPIHIAKSWSIPPFETPISVLHLISTIPQPQNDRPLL